jgi:hemoglobin
VLAAALNAGQVGDDQNEEKKTPAAEEGKEIDGIAYKALRDVINAGAEIYNAGDVSGCWHLYEGALLMLRPLLEHRPELQKTITDGLANAQQNPFMDRRAWVLREVIDKVRNETNPNPRPASIPAPKAKKDDDKKKDAPPPARKDDGVKKEASAVKPAAPLWERLGGADKIASVLDDFWAAVNNDKDLKFFRKPGEVPTKAQVNDLKEKMKTFISSVTEGPLTYSGKSMKDVHKGMGITGQEFDRVARHLEDALKKNGVKLEDVKEFMGKVNATRADVVEK